MAICNIFNDFQKISGNFLTFSQYTEDLTKHTSQYGAYKISPSKFIVMDVRYNNVRNKLIEYGINSDLNIGIPKYFQDYFENSCAFVKSNSNNWDPIIFSNLFWNSLYFSNMISVRPDDDDTCINEVKYIGDINIQSHNIFSGEGFSEIYCNIPSDSPMYIFKSHVSELTQSLYNNKNYLEGFENNDDHLLNYNETSNLRYYYPDHCILDKSWLDLSNTDYHRVDDLIDSYDFNTIIILYDIYIIDNNNNFIKYYSDIPLGMYFTGYFNGSQITSITKHIHSDDIYGMGSSYGLRICNKFIPSQNGENNTFILYGDDNNYAEFCKSLSLMSENISIMNQISREAIKYSQDIKDTLAIFKNNKINVPYIKLVGDKAYWFVNGKLIGESMEYIDKAFNVDYANDDDVKNVLYGYEN